MTPSPLAPFRKFIRLAQPSFLKNGLIYCGYELNSGPIKINVADFGNFKQVFVFIKKLIQYSNKTK